MVAFACDFFSDFFSRCPSDSSPGLSPVLSSGVADAFLAVDLVDFVDFVAFAAVVLVDFLVDFLVAFFAGFSSEPVASGASAFAAGAA